MEGAVNGFCVSFFAEVRRSKLPAKGRRSLNLAVKGERVVIGISPMRPHAEAHNKRIKRCLFPPNRCRLARKCRPSNPIQEKEDKEEKERERTKKEEKDGRKEGRQGVSLFRGTPGTSSRGLYTAVGQRSTLHC